VPVEFEKCRRSTSKQALRLRLNIFHSIIHDQFELIIDDVILYCCKSEQQLVDCSSAQGNAGCDGGWYDSAWEYLKTNELMSNENYPYTSGSTKVVMITEAFHISFLKI